MRPPRPRLPPPIVAALLFALVCLGEAAWPRAARAMGERDALVLAQLVYPGRWNSRASAPKRLAWEIEKRTSIVTSAQPAEVHLSDEAALRQRPFLYLTGEGAGPAFTDLELQRLRRHLLLGGLLLIDSADPRPGGPFDQAVRALVSRLFPRAPLQQIPADHVLYKSFYLLTTPVGRVSAVPYLEGVEHDGRLVIIYSQNDLGGAWARDNYGQWEHEVLPGGDEQREQAFRLGINLAMYALCLDYKTDQVHVPFILRRRQWQAP